MPPSGHIRIKSACRVDPAASGGAERMPCRCLGDRRRVGEVVENVTPTRSAPASRPLSTGRTEGISVVADAALVSGAGEPVAGTTATFVVPADLAGLQRLPPDPGRRCTWPGRRCYRRPARLVDVGQLHRRDPAAGQITGTNPASVTASATGEGAHHAVVNGFVLGVVMGGLPSELAVAL